MNDYRLRDFDEQEDIESFYSLRRDIDTMRYFGMDPMHSHSEAVQLIREYKERMEKGECFRKVICTKTKQYIGEIGIYKINSTHKRANSYSILLPEYRKKGVSIIIASVFYKMVFDLFNLNRIQALVDPRNVNASKSLLGIGYNYEGTLRQYEYEHGEFIDLDIYSLLRKDYMLKYYPHLEL